MATTRACNCVSSLLIMNGLYDKRSPHELLMKLKENYSDGDNEFTKKLEDIEKLLDSI